MLPRAPLVLAIAGLAACALCFFGPWFSLTVVGTGGASQMSWQDGLFGFAWTGPPGPAPVLVDIVTVQNDYGSLPHTAGVFLAAAALEIVGVAFGAATVVAPFLGRYRSHLPSLQRWFALAAGLTLAAAPTWVMLLLPAAQTADGPAVPSIAFFWGSAAVFSNWVGSATAVWGAGWAWYLSLAAAVLFLVTAALLRKSGPRAEIGPRA